MHLKELISPIIAKFIYNGFWFSPEMNFLMVAVDKSQENVSGKVYMTLYKGNVIITGRESQFSLYDDALSSMDKEGFIKINGLRLKLKGEKNEALATEISTK